VNRATFRTLDPELGRWWSVDHPDGDWIHIAVGAVIGGAINVATHWNQIDGIGSGLKAFGIGAAGGALTAATGAGVVGAGALKGFAIGAASGIAGDGLTQVGNGLAFGDQYSAKQTLLAGAIGGGIGAVTGALTVPNGVNPWTGKLASTSVEAAETGLSGAVDAAAKGGRMTVGGFGDDVSQISGYSVGSNALPDEVVVSASRTLRPTGKFLESVFDVIANPQLLKGKSLNQVRAILKNSDGWVEGTLNKGRNAGKGWTYRQLNSRGTDFTDKFIQYHPGTHRHFNGKPYWKISSGRGIFKFLAN